MFSYMIRGNDEKFSLLYVYDHRAARACSSHDKDDRSSISGICNRTAVALQERIHHYGCVGYYVCIGIYNYHILYGMKQRCYQLF